MWGASLWGHLYEGTLWGAPAPLFHPTHTKDTNKTSSNNNSVILLPTASPNTWGTCGVWTSTQLEHESQNSPQEFWLEISSQSPSSLVVWDTLVTPSGSSCSGAPQKRLLSMQRSILVCWQDEAVRCEEVWSGCPVPVMQSRSLRYSTDAVESIPIHRTDQFSGSSIHPPLEGS